MLKRFFFLLAIVASLAACDSTNSETGNASALSGHPCGNVTCGCEPVPNVGDRVFFDFDRSDLKPDARDTLDHQAKWLKIYPSVNVTVEGHCDERGTREYNLALGERRAEAVRNYLVAAGIDAYRIKTVSYGKERPAELDSNDSAWAHNRRAVTVLSK